jgi:hypothetical protein
LLNKSGLFFSSLTLLQPLNSSLFPAVPIGPPFASGLVINGRRNCAAADGKIDTAGCNRQPRREHPVQEQPHESPIGDTTGGEKSTTSVQFQRTLANTVTAGLGLNIRASSRKRTIENFG